MIDGCTPAHSKHPVLLSTPASPLRIRLRACARACFTSKHPPYVIRPLDTGGADGGGGSQRIGTPGMA
eukprot:1160704-Pelagomonas_calceolata.AAC.3